MRIRRGGPGTPLRLDFIRAISEIAPTISTTSKSRHLHSTSSNNNLAADIRPINQIMSTKSKPTIIFVSGAWHKAELYAPLTNALLDKGFPVLAPTLPSVGGTCDSFDDDVSLIRGLIEQEVSAVHEVVILMHSYGGLVGSAAAQGYSKEELQKENAGVIKMIFMTAFALDVGVSLMDALNNTPLPWFESANDKQWGATDASRIFYNDVDQQIATDLESKLDLHSKGTFLSKQNYAAWKHIDSLYIVCENDNAIPKDAQVAMASQAGGRFTIEYLAAGHSPFLSMPEQTVDVISRAIAARV